MASNARSFTAGIGGWVEGGEDEVGKIHRAATLDLLREVATETPVDTGRARANWQVGRKRPPTGETDDTDTSSGASSTVSRESEEIARIRPFSISYVANNLPYIGSLNDGHSKQAPKGFVDAAFERVKTRYSGREGSRS